MLSDADLAAIREREAKATPGPWTIREMDDGALVIDFGPDWRLAGDSSLPSPSNAAFIAAARTDIPTLLAEISRLKDELAAVQFPPGKLVVSEPLA